MSPQWSPDYETKLSRAGDQLMYSIVSILATTKVRMTPATIQRMRDAIDYALREITAIALAEKSAGRDPRHVKRDEAPWDDEPTNPASPRGRSRRPPRL